MSIEFDDGQEEVAASSEFVGPPKHFVEIGQIVDDFMKHATIRKKVTKLELQLVAAIFNTYANNWEPGQGGQG